MTRAIAGMKMSSKCIAFDLYGTLLDTSSISRKLSEYLPQSIRTDHISAEWRRYQLEYTWRLTSMGTYESFDVVTRKSLKHAASEAGCSLSENVIEDVVKSYDQLNVFEDVTETLESLMGVPNLSTVIFSNGTDQMVRNSIKNCPELKYFSELVRPFIVVDEVRRYKPSRAAYHHLATKLEKEHSTHDVWLVSGNPFDIVGARQAGLNAIWVDRRGKGWFDQLGEPTKTVKSLREVTDILSQI